MFKIITIICAACLISSCKSKPVCPDLGNIPEEGEKMYVAVGTNRDGKKAPQNAILVINITSKYDSATNQRRIVIDTIFALQRRITTKDSTGKETESFSWIATTRDSVKLLNPMPVDSLIQ